MRTKEELATIFRQHGLRITPQRECLFEVMASFEGQHPTAEEIWAAVCRRHPSVSLKTVYDILHELVALGEVRKIELGHVPSRFEAGHLSHHHMLCTGCGKVESAGEEPSIASPGLSHHGDFEVTQVEVIFRGLCADCSQRLGAGVLSHRQTVTG